MASSEGSSGTASQLPKPEATPIVIKIKTKITRRQWTLLTITALLHVLLWSSLCTIVTSIYLIAADAGDSTNIPSEVLTLASTSVSIAYIILHTVFSLKQRIWKHQRRNPSIIKKTSYIAVRLTVTLCILWLLTCGWNLITVARQPVCLPAGAGLEGWEAGTTCVVGRVGTALSMIALLASCTLFYMLAVVRRPFEAHLIKYNYRQSANPYPTTPAVSRRPSPSRSASFASDKYRGRASASTRRSTLSSNTDAETIDLGSASPPSTIHAPSPMRSIGLGIFQTSAQPPPLPPAFMPHGRASSLENLPPIFHPSVSSLHLPPPPGMSALIAPGGFVPIYNPKEYSASAWRAVHPNAPSPLRPIASRSNPHLPNTASAHNFNFYRSGYSRSSVSLTRPNRLSSTTPPLPAGSVTWSSRSGSTGPEEGRRSRSPGSGSGSVSAGASDCATNKKRDSVAYEILAGAAVAKPSKARGRKQGHVRRASAPDATAGASQQYSYSGRKAKGWKPELQGQDEGLERGNSVKAIVRSSSAELLSKFSPRSSPEDNVNLRQALEKELDARWNVPVQTRDRASVRKSRSERILRSSDVPEGAERATKISRMPQDPRMKGKRRMTFEEVKNKPLPKIAVI